MNLHRLLLARAAEGRPLTVGLIGAGKFGAMYLAQAKHTPGIHVVGIADLAPDRAKASLARTGWAPGRDCGARRSPPRRSPARPSSATTRWR